MKGVLYKPEVSHSSPLPSLSPSKRKREDLKENISQEAQMRVRTLKKIQARALQAASVSGHVFSSSDFILQSSKGLFLIRDSFGGDLEPVTTVLSEEAIPVVASSSMCDINHLEGNWRELLVATKNGDIFSAMVDDDGHVTTLLRESHLDLDREVNEQVTAIFHGGLFDERSAFAL